MFRAIARAGVSSLRSGVASRQAAIVSARPFSHAVESEAEIDARFEKYFARTDLDSWELRKGLSDMHGMDMVPNPKICVEVLKACRRINDYALTVRFLEALKDKTEGVPHMYTHLMKELQPTMAELGVSPLEELGYDKPELYLQSVYEIN